MMKEDLEFIWTHWYYDTYVYKHEFYESSKRLKLLKLLIKKLHWN